MKAILPLGIIFVLVLSACTRTVSSTQIQPPRTKSSLPPALERQVRNAVDAGDGDVKVRQLRQQMAREPDNLAVRIELAGHFEKSGHPDLALEHFRLAFSRFPDSEDVALGLVRLLRSAGEREQALEVLGSFTIRHSPSGPALSAWKGIILDEMGRYTEAERFHRAAVAFEPAQDYLHNNLGYNLLLQGRHQDAQAEFRQALSLNRNSEIARNNLATALSSNPGEALLVWKSAGDLAAAHNNLAVQYLEAGRVKEARKELETALSHRRDSPEVLHNLRIVSELDGQSITLPPAARASFWRRFAGGLKKIFIESGPAEVPREPRGRAYNMRAAK